MIEDWLRALPESLHSNPEVVVVLAPDDAKWQVTKSEDGRVVFGLMKLAHTEEVLGLQVLSPDVGPREEHTAMLRAAGITPAPVAYAGRLSGLPQSMLNHHGMCPLVMLRDQPNRQFWNLKRHFMKEDAVWN